MWSAGGVSVLAIADAEGVVGESVGLALVAELFADCSLALSAASFPYEECARPEHPSNPNSKDVADILTSTGLPSRLRAILEDPRIVKQGFGAFSGLALVSSSLTL
jgi:hypothetical protein